MAIDHDQIFKTLIQAFFREFMELFLPEEAALVDFDRVEFLKQEHFTDVPRGKRKRLDLVAKAGLKRGGEKFILIHTEFEAEKEMDFPKRVYRYHNRLFDAYDTVIVPVAVFSDDARWRKPVPDFFELKLHRTYVHFQYHLIKLKHLDYRTFLESENPLAYALMAKMNYSRRQRVRLKAEFLRLILGAEVDPARRSLLVNFVETYMPLSKPEEAEYERIVATEFEYEEVTEMITVYEERGLKEGKREGRREGKQELLTRQLEKRFGRLDATMKQRIREIKSSAKLNALSVALLDAQSLDDLDL